MVKIKNKGTSAIWTINDSISLEDIQKAEPLFFKTKHGKRETYEIYRGFLIVRHTVKFTHSNERRTVVYMFGEVNEQGSIWTGTHCVSAGTIINNSKDAHKLIDKIISSGEYYYGIDFRNNVIMNGVIL